MYFFLQQSPGCNCRSPYRRRSSLTSSRWRPRSSSAAAPGWWRDRPWLRCRRDPCRRPQSCGGCAAWSFPSESLARLGRPVKMFQIVRYNNRKLLNGWQLNPAIPEGFVTTFDAFGWNSSSICNHLSATPWRNLGLNSREKFIVETWLEISISFSWMCKLLIFSTYKESQA